MHLLLSITIFSLLLLGVPVVFGSKIPTKSNIKFRNVRDTDIAPLAVLCADTFEGPFGMLDFFQKNKYESEFAQQISDRYRRLVLNGMKHAMLLAETENEGIVGFLEIGMLPSPIPVKKQWEGQEIEERPEVPYLGNVAVSSTCRRQGMGSKLVRIAEKVAEKWQEDGIFVAVESDNASALQMYKKLKFDVVLDERDNINRRGSRLFLRKALSEADADGRDRDSSNSQVDSNV